jgi:hypothetical protein
MELGMMDIITSSNILNHFELSKAEELNKIVYSKVASKQSTGYVMYYPTLMGHMVPTWHILVEFITFGARIEIIGLRAPQLRS